jgi:hypothetical protein
MRNGSRVGLLCGLVALLFVLALTAQSEINRDQALRRIEQSLLPQGKDNVVLEIWGPIPAGTEIRGTKELVMVAPATGYAVYIDDTPTANLFHPVRYGFVNATTGMAQVANAMSPPANLADYERVSTVIGDRLMAAQNVYAAPVPALTPPPVTPTRGERWAVLMNGGYDSGNNHVRYWNDLSNIYMTLDSVYGYADDHIIVLCSDGLNTAPDQSNGQNSNPDLDNDGDADIMYSCVQSNVDLVFGWLATHLYNGDQLFVFTTDHGGPVSGMNVIENLWNHEEMTDAHFAQLVDALPAGVIVTYTLEPCNSGGFMDNLIVPSFAPIVGSSACSYSESSWAMGPNYLYDTYVFHWTAAVKGHDAYGVAVNADYNHDGQVTFNEAYQYAVANDHESEHPQYGEQPTGLGATTSLWPQAAGLAPAAPTNFTVSANQAQLMATLNWTNPTLTFNGQPLTSIDRVVIKRNGLPIDSLMNMSPGQAVTYNNNVPNANSYNYSVYAVNGAGNGISVSGTAWIGLDTPGPVTSLTGAGVGTTLVANLSWVNPLVGGHDGYWPIGTISGYMIHRYGPNEATFNVNGIQTAYSDATIPVQGWYHYGVTPVDASGNGPETMTPNFFVGPPEFQQIAYDWVEISSLGTNTGLNQDDQNLGPFNLGFNFPWYGGTSFNQVRVCSNGWISFTSTITAFTNSQLPNSSLTSAPANGICALWDDLYPPGPPVGTIWYYYDAANSRFIVEWDNVCSYSVHNPQKFEIILYPSGMIDFQYNLVQTPSTGSNTVGIQNATGTVGIQVTYNGSGPLEPSSHMGVRIFSVSPPNTNVDITLTPLSPPIVIPAVGGSFQFTAQLANASTSPASFGVWIMQQLPNLTWQGPMLGPLNLTIPASTTVTRTRTQNVPASAPTGLYTYRGFVGLYPSTKWDSSSFTYTKSATGDGPIVDNWDNYGDSFEPYLTGNPAPAPQTYSLGQNYPNPFNPSTTISFTLPQAGPVFLQVFDLQGRMVAELVNGLKEAGAHQVTWDASSVASGLYFCRLQAGSFNQVRKMMLVK